MTSPVARQSAPPPRLTGLSATVNVSHAEGALDTLAVDTRGGADTVDSAGLAPGDDRARASSDAADHAALVAPRRPPRGATARRACSSTAATWWSTVRTESTSRSAICALVSPSLSKLEHVELALGEARTGWPASLAPRARGPRGTPAARSRGAHAGGRAGGVHARRGSAGPRRRLRASPDSVSSSACS